MSIAFPKQAPSLGPQAYWYSLTSSDLSMAAAYCIFQRTAIFAGECGNASWQSRPELVVAHARLVHEIRPDHRRKASAGHAAHRGVVIIPDPYADKQIAGEASKPGIVVILAGARVAV
jgi:hypothetical protein